MGPEALRAATALAIVLAIVLAAAVAAGLARGTTDSFSGCRACAGDGSAPEPVREPSGATQQPRGGEWVGGRGPYNLQLYDSPRYYPYYEARDYANVWDTAGRCSVSCSASQDGGCSVICR